MEEKISQRRHALTVEQILLVLQSEAEDNVRNRAHAKREGRYLDYIRCDAAINTLESYIEWIEENDY